jgi:hypothetical protein
MLQDWKELIQKKKSDVCVFLGSGKSINDINTDEWEKFKKYDTWAINNWIYHPFFVPKFYHIEAKYYDYSLLKQRLKEKKEQYKNTNFIFKESNIKINNKKEVLWKIADNFSNIYIYSRKRRKGISRDNKVWNSNYSIEKKYITNSYDVSLSGILEMIYRIGYKTIIMYGVDLYNSYYFWSSGDQKYGKVHHLTNKAHENKNPEEPHNTWKIHEYIKDFNERWMIPNKRKMFVGNKKTMLFPEIPFIDILEIR